MAQDVVVWRVKLFSLSDLLQVNDQTLKQIAISLILLFENKSSNKKSLIFLLALSFSRWHGAKTRRSPESDRLLIRRRGSLNNFSKFCQIKWSQTLSEREKNCSIISDHGAQWTESMDQIWRSTLGSFVSRRTAPSAQCSVFWMITPILRTLICVIEHGNWREIRAEWH